MPTHAPFVVLFAWLLCSVVTTSRAQNDTPSAFNNVTLQPPPIPSPLPATQFTISPQSNAQNVAGLSIPHPGSFFGFSIEMSVANQVVGSSPQVLQVPFLNLLSIITQRAGQVNVRIGGNTQDFATYVDNLPDGDMISKDNDNTAGPTNTPPVSFTADFIYMFANVSSLVNAKWYFGIPMIDVDEPRLQIAEVSEAIMGDHLLGFQVGNEPDLYLPHQHRTAPYGPPEYAKEFGMMVNAINNDQKITTRGNLIAPSLSGTQESKGWTLDAIWDANFIQEYSSAIGALAVERYPDNNCFEKGNGAGKPKNAQDVFPEYLTHQTPVNTVTQYLAHTALAQTVGKPFLMFETNSASCGGFDGVSDSFGAALWALDYGLQMAHGNFSGALLHVGGMDVSYNPFTPPMTGQSLYRQWTIGPVFYSVVAVAEALGRSGKAQVIDIWPNNGSPMTPGYAIYDNGNLDKVALFNYMTDQTGAAAYVATISIAGSNTPATVSVKYLLADSVSQKFNITWAGQTLGVAQYETDGRWIGDESIETVQCNQVAGTCPIKVPAPGFALVFLGSDLTNYEITNTETFATTTCTAARGRCPSLGTSGPTVTKLGLPGLTYSSSSTSTASARPNDVANGALNILPSFTLFSMFILTVITTCMY